MAYRFSWIAGAAGILLALARMERLLRPADVGPPWQLALLAGAIIGTVITWTAFSYRIRAFGIVLLNLAGMVLAAFRLGAADTLIAGVFPTSETFPTLWTELGYAVGLIRFGASPVFAPAGMILILTIVFWLLGILLAAGLLNGRPAVALLPPLLFYLQIATIDRLWPGYGWMTGFLVVAAIGLLAVALDERSLTAGRLRRAFDTQHIPMSSPTVPGAFVAVAVAASVLLAGIASGVVPASGFLNWRARTGLGGGIFSGVSFNLFADITQVDLTSRSEEPAFFATIEGDYVPADLYWKMITLDSFDGDNWFPGRIPTYRAGSDIWEAPDHRFKGATTFVRAEVTIDDLTMNVLPVIYSPVDFGSESALLRQSHRVRADGSIMLDLPTWRGLTYQIVSRVPVPDLGVLASQPGRRDQLSPIFQEAADRGVFTQRARSPQSFARPEDVDDYLELPDDLSTDIVDEARVQTREGSTDFERALLLEAWFRDPNQFRYSVDIEPGHSARDLAEWLTDPDSPNYRTGYCEQFAVAMATMARTIGIPSRVVLGFTPGERTADGTIVVRGKNAHAWVELWMDGQGWVRFDPTPRGDEVNPATISEVAAGFDPRDYIPAPDEQTTPPTVPPGDRGIDDILDRQRGDEPFPPLGIPGPILEFAGFRLSWLQVVVLFLVLAAGSIPLAKWIRRRRRLARLRHGDITGAWDEIVDRLVDLGRSPSPGQTPIEVAASVHRSMEPLAHTVGVVFYGKTADLSSAKVGQARTSFAETESYLREIYRPVDRIVAGLRPRSLKWWRRD